GRLRPRARRRARGRRSPLLRVAPGRTRRRADPALRAAVAAQPGVPGAPGPARAAAPQHHAARVLCGLGRRAGADLPDRARGARDSRAALRARPRRQRVQPARAGGARRGAHERTADLPRLRALPRAREPRAAPPARRRRDEPAVRRPPGAEQAPRGPDPPRELLAPLPLAGRAAGAGRQAAAPHLVLRRAAGASVRGGLHPVRGDVPGPRLARRADRLLPGRARVRLDERARGLRRTARGVDADARAGARLLGRRRAAHARGRGRAVQAEAPRRGRRARPRAFPRRGAARPGPRRSGSPPGSLRPRARARLAPELRGVAVSERPEIAFVVQRYGEGVTGGSESLARAIAGRLAADYRITVFTSRARDYVSWRNELPGEERLGGVDVRRFPAERERDLDAFNAYAEPLYARAAAAAESPTAAPTLAEELEFLRLQGPETPKL